MIRIGRPPAGPRRRRYRLVDAVADSAFTALAIAALALNTTTEVTPMIRTATVSILCCDTCQAPLCDPDTDSELVFTTPARAVESAPAYGWFTAAGVLCADTPHAGDCRATAAAKPHDVVTGPTTAPDPAPMVCLLCGDIADSLIHTDRHRVLDVDQVALDLDHLPAGVTTANKLGADAAARHRFIVVGSRPAIEAWRAERKLPRRAVLPVSSANALRGVSGGPFTLVVLPSAETMPIGTRLAISEDIRIVRACGAIITTEQEGPR